jgi:hypothetical protein
MGMLNMSQPRRRIREVLSDNAELLSEIRLLKNQIDYMEQTMSAFIAHFGQHGHTVFENGTPTGKPAQFKFPIFHPSKAPMTEVPLPQVETEVKTLTVPNSKPQPIPTP